MESLSVVEATKVKTLRPPVLVQIRGKIVIRIDQVGILSGPSLDIFLGLVGRGLVVPELEVRRRGLFLSIRVFREDSEISSTFGGFGSMESLGELLVADLCVRGRGFSKTWHFSLKKKPKFVGIRTKLK
jgi:hypothetical protein